MVRSTTSDFARWVHDHLYGVDINYTATRLCELRIWDGLLAATPQYAVPNMPPLPNLTHRIVTGDALIEPFDLVSRRTRAGVLANSDVLRGDRAQRLAFQLQRTYLNCHGRQKPPSSRRARCSGESQRGPCPRDAIEALASRCRTPELHATEIDLRMSGPIARRNVR
ncbi:MAG: hypothetical protein R3E66_13655 [bacterium]